MFFKFVLLFLALYFNIVFYHCVCVLLPSLAYSINVKLERLTNWDIFVTPCMLTQMADVVEREHYPSSRDADSDVIAAGPAAGAGSHQQRSDGFSVRGAPWSNMAPDTNSRDDFPDLAQVLLYKG